MVGSLSLVLYLGITGVHGLAFCATSIDFLRCWYWFGVWWDRTTRGLVIRCLSGHVDYEKRKPCMGLYNSLMH